MLVCCVIIICIVIICILLCKSNNKEDKIFKEYSSTKDKPYKENEKKTSISDLDYFMTPIIQATRVENKKEPKKSDIYKHYNEAIARYNRISPEVIRHHPKVPNIETIINQRNRAYEDMIQEEGFGTITNGYVAPPIPVVKKTPSLLPFKKHNLNIEIKSSSQNVHDTNVNDELSNRYQIIKNSQLANDSDGRLFTNMIDFIDKNDKKKNIVKNFDYDEEISRFKDQESNIWYTVWKRIHAPENSDNIESLKNSFRDAVIDCTEDGSTVCTVGRVTRALNSLTLMDKNTNIATPVKTDDIERKEVYDKAYTILQRELDKMGSKFKESYESGEMTNTEVFDDKVKEAIKQEVGQSKYLDDALAAI